jgi:endonuclease YncB( thermonuclease family)
MSPVIPFRPRSTVPSAVWIMAGAVLAFATTYIFLEWQGNPSPTKPHRVQIIRPAPPESGPIEVIDGDTVRLQGVVYRLIGFDTPERGDKARCDDERHRADEATKRLRSLVAKGETSFKRVACACRPGEEGTRLCNYGRLCGSLRISGEDVGRILISEGLARSYVCNATSCPKRHPWC